MNRYSKYSKLWVRFSCSAQFVHSGQLKEQKKEVMKLKWLLPPGSHLHKLFSGFYFTCLLFSTTT